MFHYNRSCVWGLAFAADFGGNVVELQAFTDPVILRFIFPQLITEVAGVRVFFTANGSVDESAALLRFYEDQPVHDGHIARRTTGNSRYPALLAYLLNHNEILSASFECFATERPAHRQRITDHWFSRAGQPSRA